MSHHKEPLSEKRISISVKAGILLLIATALAIGSFRTDDPWVVGPSLFISWGAFICLFVIHQGGRIKRTIGGIFVTAVFVFLAWRLCLPPPIPEDDMHILQITNLMLRNSTDVCEMTFDLSNISERGFTAEKCVAYYSFVYPTSRGPASMAPASILPQGLTNPTDIPPHISEHTDAIINKKQYNFYTTADDAFSDKCDIKNVIVYKIEGNGWYAYTYDSVVNLNNPGGTILRYSTCEKIPEPNYPPYNLK